jgi:hypothetical protein
MDMGAVVTTQQTTFVSIIVSMLSASFAIWVGKEHSSDRSGNSASK